jgi:hypothetical protein
MKSVRELADALPISRPARPAELTHERRNNRMRSR